MSISHIRSTMTDSFSDGGSTIRKNGEIWYRSDLKEFRTQTGGLIVTMPSSGNDIKNRRTVTGTASLDPPDTVTAITSISGAITLTLPDPSTLSAGKMMTIIDESGSVSDSNKVTVDAAGGGLINGSASFDLTTAYDSVSFICNGTNWFKMSNFLAEAGAAAAASLELLLSPAVQSSPLIFGREHYLFIPA